MENALRACCKGIKIGKILVHRCAGGAAQPRRGHRQAFRRVLQAGAPAACMHASLALFPLSF